MTLNADPGKPMHLLIGLIRQLETTMPVDSNGIYITGLSMGGYGTFDALERYPNLFAAAVPVCGAGDTSRAASIAHVPMWIYLGAEVLGETGMCTSIRHKGYEKAGPVKYSVDKGPPLGKRAVSPIDGIEPSDGMFIMM